MPPPWPEKPVEVIVLVGEGGAWIDPLPDVVDLLDRTVLLNCAFVGCLAFTRKSKLYVVFVIVRG